MKLATVNPRMDFNMEALLSKEVSWSNFLNSVSCLQERNHMNCLIRLLYLGEFQIFQSRGTLPQSLYPLDSSALAFPYGYHSQQGPPSLQNGIPNGSETPFSVNPLTAALRRTPSMQLPPIDGFSEAPSQVMNDVNLIKLQPLPMVSPA